MDASPLASGALVEAPLLRGGMLGGAGWWTDWNGRVSQDDGEMGGSDGDAASLVLM